MTHRELEWQLRRLEMLRRVLGNQIMQAAGLQRGRLPVLEYVMEHEGTSQRAVAEVLHITPASVTVTVRRMENDGLLRREASADDQRTNRLYTTAEGRRLTRQCRAGFDALNRRMFDGLTLQECDALNAGVKRLFDNLAGTEYRDFPFISPNTLTRITPPEEEPHA